MPSSSLTAYVILNCFLGFTYSPQTIYVSILNYFVIFFITLSVYKFIPTFPVLVLYFITVDTPSLWPFLVYISELIQPSFNPMTSFSRLSEKILIFFSFFYAFCQEIGYARFPNLDFSGYVIPTVRLKNRVKCCLVGFFFLSQLFTFLFASLCSGLESQRLIWFVL